MDAVDNILRNVGDIAVISVKVKATASIRLNSFIEDIEGIESPNVDVFREFRITSDNIFWSDWRELTEENLYAEEIRVNPSSIIQIRYTRIGDSDVGEIIWNSIEFTGEAQVIEFDAPTLNSSIFKNIFNSDDTRAIADNLFKKLYFRGVIPKYIARGENRDAVEDQDYISLTKTIGFYFSLFIQFFRRFDGLISDDELIRAYVSQYGLFYNETDVRIEDLQYLTSHLLDEIRKRGTGMIFRRKGEELSNGTLTPIDGELVRLLNSSVNDELSREVIPNSKTGFCIGNSSPLYRGTHNSVELNKTPDSSGDFSSLERYTTSSVGGGDVGLLDVDGKRVIYLNSIGVGSAGIGTGSENKFETVFIMDADLDYEINFDVRITKSSSGGILKFGLTAFDDYCSVITAPFLNAANGEASEIFLEESTISLKEDEWYKIRGYIHAYSTAIIPQSKLNVGMGNNLIFYNAFIKRVLPYIQLIQSDSSEVGLEIWNYKVRPAVRGRNVMPLMDGTINSHSMGFVQCPDITYIYARNNNPESSTEIENIIDKYLLPYNSTLILELINN